MITIKSVTSKIKDPSGNLLSGTIVITPNTEFEYDEGSDRVKVPAVPKTVTFTNGVLASNFTLAPTKDGNHNKANILYIAVWNTGNATWTEYWELSDDVTNDEYEITAIPLASVNGLPAYTVLTSATSDDVSNASTVTGATVTAALERLWAVATTIAKGLMSAADKTKLDSIAEGAEVNAVDSVAGKTGIVTLDKTDVGLGNVDNTSDANKPVSTATQTALDLKVTGGNGINAVVALTQAAYDALDPKVATTLYVITD